MVRLSEIRNPILCVTVGDQAGSVNVDVSRVVPSGTQLLGLKYGWPVDKSGDSCCPHTAVQQGHM